MHLLHINSYFATTALYSNLYDRQRAAGLSLTVYVPVAKECCLEDLACYGQEALIHPCFWQMDRYIFHLKHYKIWHDLKASVNFEAVDLIHAHSLFSNGWLAYQAHKKYAIPYVVAVRSADVRTFFQKLFWLRSLGLNIMKAAQQIIFISRNTYQEVLENYIPAIFKKAFQEKAQVIPNGIHDYWHQAAAQKPRTRLHCPVRIVCTCKLQKQKEIPRLIQYIQAYNKKVQPAELHIIGPNYDDRILKLIKKSDHVIYHGPQNKPGMVEIYQDMDIFALISSRETFGLVYAEAMSQSLPIIYTRGEGFDSFMPNHTVGESTDYRNEDEFIENLDRIIKAYPERSKAALRASEQFNWDDIAKTYQKLYEKVLKP